MNTNTIQPSHNRYLGLLRSLEGLRDGTAITLLIGSSVIAAILFLAGVSIGGGWVLLFGLVAYVISSIGVSAAGGVLMDSARNISRRSMGDAIVVGVADLVKIIGLTILGGLALVVYLIVLAIVLFLCKIPGLGPVLFGLLLPILVILSALVVYGILAALMLSNSAVWEGSSFQSALARVAGLASKRLPEVLISFLLLWLLMAIVGGVVASVMFTGYFLVAGMSVPIIGPSIGMGGFGGLGAMGFGGGEGMGYVIAGGFGSAVLFAVTVAAMLAVFIMGVNLIYLSACEGLDSAAMEGDFNERLQGVKQKADEMQQRVRERAQEAQDRARQAVAERSVQSAAPVSQVNCPACGAAATAHDLFCGECGHKF